MKLSILLITLYLINSGSSLLMREEPLSAVEKNIQITQTVDEDLKSFNFDYERYKMNPEVIYRPILITYKESISNDYYDLIYFYDPNNQFNIMSVSTDILVGNNPNKLTKFKTETYQLLETGKSSDGTIKRYAFNAYENYRKEYNYRQYNFKQINFNNYSIELNNAYLFNGGNLEFSNCLNVRLEDPHAWSWHFDEQLYQPDIWESILNYFGGIEKNQLKDQLFYSFYLANNWNVKEIKSIDIQYKKVLLEANRYNIADIGSNKEYYSPEEYTLEDDYIPNYYAWSNNNSLNNYDKSNLLGHTIKEIGNFVNYTNKTITPEVVSSVGLKHDNTWKKIQNSIEFKNVFGEKSEIYQFASKYFSQSQRYYVINFDDFYYEYINSKVASRNWNLVDDEEGHHYQKINQPFTDYLRSHDVKEQNVISGPSYTPDYTFEMPYYHFFQEYTFDISAKYITYEDYANIEYTMPVSVAPINQEASGGFPESPKNKIWQQILITILVVLSILILTPIVFKIIKVIQSSRTNYLLNKNIKLQKQNRSNNYKRRKRK